MNRVCTVVVVLATILFLLPSRAKSEDPPAFTPQSLEFFEKEVRPILVRRCYECHSVQAKKRRGGLHLDSRAALVKGGDTGPAMAPGKPDESLLVDAINYGDIYQMPPKSKLPAEEIGTLTRWVAMGAPWPKENVAANVRDETLDIAARKASHWSWKPLVNLDPPKVKQTDWPSDPLDHFILARLEEAGLAPAKPADKRMLIRRVYFDLIGLPPSPEQVESFLSDATDEAYASVVDSLLESPHFGERWGRHWLDLVRYAESRGHEFDYTTPNAHHYRDYVIRAFNDDIPYRQFVIEHVAGDLLDSPRVHPETGANESILATGFWFLGEWVHSPVDIRKDETDRFDNMLDVFSKTFLGLTVACARCHDHKFDAISQTDYYALAGFLQSSAYRQARFDSLQHNGSVAKQAAALRRELGAQVKAEGLSWSDSQWNDARVYLASAVEVVHRSLTTPTKQTTIVVDDFEDGDYSDWTLEGEAFNGVAQDAASIADYQGNVNAQGKYFINSHNLRQSLDEKAKHSDHWQGKMVSPPFRLERSFLQMLVGGGSHAGKTCVNLLVDGKAVRTITGRSNNRMEVVRWRVADLRGREARIEIVDGHSGGWGNIGVDHIVLTSSGEGPLDQLSSETLGKEIAAVAGKHGLDRSRLEAWSRDLLNAASDEQHPLHAVAGVLAGADAAKTWATRVQAEAENGEDVDFGDARVIANYLSAKAESKFLQDGVSFGVGLVRAGDVLVEDGKVTLATRGAARRDPMFRKLSLTPGTQRDGGRLARWDRAGKTMRTGAFVLEPKPLFYLVRGRGLAYGVVASHRMINGPLHGSLIHEFNTKGALQWVRHDLKRYAGQDAHVEFTAIDQDPLEVYAVVQADQPPAGLAQWDALDRQLAEAVLVDDRDALVKKAASALRASAIRCLGERDSEPTARDLARSAWLLSATGLREGDVEAKDADARHKLVKAIEELEGRVKLQSRTCLAMWDGDSHDERLLIRGNNRTPADYVPRRMLVALDGSPHQTRQGSGRLQLAEEIFQDDNPYPARVMVNRVWHHLTGRGLVPSTDNFGVLGQAPSHPELLDHLATAFREDDWSVKRLIRRIVLSRTYRMTSTPSPQAEAKDPTNVLLHRMRIRRLQAEAVRDAVLSVSGRIDRTLFGPSVPVHLTPFMQGRGRPQGGPLDGNGRRSIYISVRRNFLSPMMLAFDAPQPFSTVGRRSVSNVPAQALIMMNDPLVAEQSAYWAKNLLTMDGLPETKIERCYLQALSRPPAPEEVEAAIAFLEFQAKELGVAKEAVASDVRIWSDFCHVLMNTKEFLFVR